MSPVRQSTRLTVWTGGQDEHAVVITSDGELAGLVRYGHMLEPSAFRPVVDQLIKTGTVRRAVLGVELHEVAPDDPQRVQFAALGTRPAGRIERIVPNSAAAVAGLQEGDLILAMGGEPVHDLAHFAAAIANQSGNTELRVLRDGHEIAVTVDLQPKAEPSQGQ
jgi:S1-C subfamily serine protease